MLREAWRGVRRVRRIARFMATEPVEALIEIEAQLMERRERRRPPCAYTPDDEGERRLHRLLGVPWPCPAAAEFAAVWAKVGAAVKAKGLRIGRATFSCYNDADPGLLRTLWCLTRHLEPRRVVETGVARGFTSRMILEGLERNGVGHLWSIDRPPPAKRELHPQVGAAVEPGVRHRWSYIRGSSRRHLPGLLARLHRLDLFLHDSRHSAHTVRFELEHAWTVLAPGGVLVVDDIDLNRGFQEFTDAHSGHHTVIRYAEPLRPDPSRFGGTGLFGIIRKEPALGALDAQAARSHA